MSEQARAFAIYSALLLSVGGAGGFAGGRVTAPAPPPAEVRYVPVHVPAPAPLAQAVPIEPEVTPPAEMAPVVPIEPAVTAPAIETKPPAPKVEAKPKVIKPQAKPEAKSRPRAPKKSLPSCAVVQQKFNAMTVVERWAEYRRATPEEIAYGKRCLGF